MLLVIELKLEKPVKDIEKLIEGRIYTIDGINNKANVKVLNLERVKEAVGALEYADRNLLCFDGEQYIQDN